MPSFDIEHSYSPCVVCGVDEAGRGPLAGPVVAAAVILPPDFDTTSINDSKKLSSKKRQELFERITSKAIYSIAMVDEKKIDEINILNATKLAMTNAILGLSILPNIALIDGNAPPKPIERIKLVPVVKGDSKSFSIAAASIVAKVTRDKIMLELSEIHPEYNWSKNAGYGTSDHITAITEHGITPYHRRTFAPIKNMV